MNRRTLLAGLAALPLASRARADQPEWQARLVAGGFDGKNYIAGLQITLAPGWKTYWRVPGEAGIPPSINVKGDNIEMTELLSPLPKRIIDASGESIGFHDEVVFLLSIKPKEPEKSVSAQVSAFFGVCQNICKPAKFSGTAELRPGIGESAPVLTAWQAKLPIQSEFISSATQNADQLVISLKQTVDDLFVEGPEGLYFRKPVFSNGKAALKIDGLQPGQKLFGEKLRLTAVADEKGLEQTIAVT
jgi:DsbC/DsbD-like thiol-disulfide interchange protein